MSWLTVQTALRRGRSTAILPLLAAWALAAPSLAWADGKMFVPRDYQGSVEERSQEAILIFQGADQPGTAIEDLILKVRVQGAADKFAWVIPFPTEPKVAKEDAKLFAELHAYVEARLADWRSKSRYPSDGAKAEQKSESPSRPVEVLSRKIVGSYDVAVVREKQEGGLNRWLEAEGYQTLEAGDEVIAFYRQKQYVFACIKVSEAELKADAAVDLHPLRFSFKTGGRDGIYFPMKMTGLQEDRFDVNLYVFYGAWLNDQLNKFGYENRGFQRKFRDWDTAECEANAGKNWSAPDGDVYLADKAHLLPTVTGLFQKLHPGQRYYLTNIQARALAPESVRDWSDDLWLFPYYTDREFVPYDVRPGGPAATAWPNERAADAEDSEEGQSAGVAVATPSWIGLLVAVPLIGSCVLLVGGAVVVGILWMRKSRRG